jgi:RimJ/RimL family protein N-acetyltransferase
MQDAALLEATGSELMTLDEEIENQQSWRDDDTKCTFIILAREAFEDDDSASVDDPDFVARNLHAMIGDVNLFLSEEEDEEEIDPFAPPPVVDPSAPPLPQQAEVDIMIAESVHQGKGLGKEATSLMMLYGATHFPSHDLRRFFCKINEDNVASRNLFSKKLGFVEKEYVAVFQQYELELKRETNDELVDCLKEMVGGELQISACPIPKAVKAEGL